jgi:hypothetical protein
LHPWLDTGYQSSLANELWSATRNLPLNVTSIDMLGIPVVHWVRAVELDEERRPWIDPLAPQEEEEDEGANRRGEFAHSASSQASESAATMMDAGCMGSCVRMQRAEEAASSSSSGSSDVFLSRPADETGPVGGNSSAPSSTGGRQLRFVAGETIDVEVFLSNPLKVPLLIQRISLSVRSSGSGSGEAVPFESFPASLTLPPESFNHRILLSGLPLSAGSISIVGVSIRCFNLLHLHRVDSFGRGIRPDYDEADSASPYCPDCTPPAPAGWEQQGDAPPSLKHIEIVAPLPRLSLRYALLGNLDRSFLLGEVRQAELLLSNRGPLPIADIELLAETHYVAGSSQAQDAYYANEAEQEEIRENTLKKEKAKAAAAGVEFRTPRRAESTRSLTGLLSPGGGGGGPGSGSFGGNSAGPPRRRLVTFDPAALQAQLPLKPGGCIRLKIDIVAHTEW